MVLLIIFVFDPVSPEDRKPEVELGPIAREPPPTIVISEEPFHANEELDVDTVEVDL